MVADLLRGLVVSLEIFVFTLAIALPLGFPLALGRMSGTRKDLPLPTLPSR